MRAGEDVDQDYMKKVNANDLSKENDWAVYSAGAMIDPLLYNIRRERRCELMSEGFRYDDLKRWRALDQVQNSVVEGFNLWDNAYTLYTGANEKLIQPGEAGTPNVSAKATSKYLRPYQIVTTNNDLFNGYTWMKGYYLSPIPAFEIRISASNMDDPSTSPLYQNPYWPTQANGSATE